MESRVAVIGIIIENPDCVERVNSLLHDYSPYILGRMGIPYRERGINIISIAIDAPQDIISTLSGKIGRLQGVSAKTAYSGVISKASIPPHLKGENHEKSICIHSGSGYDPVACRLRLRHQLFLRSRRRALLRSRAGQRSRADSRRSRR